MALLQHLLDQTWHQLQTLNVFHLILLLPILLLSLFVLFLITASPAAKLKLPPTPKRLPIIGNLHQLGTSHHRSLQALSDKHGPLMLLHLGRVPTLVVSSADLAKEVMKTHDSVFSSRPKTTAPDILFYGCEDVLFSPYGEFWRQTRKICVMELLSPKSVAQFQYAREEETAELVGKIRGASRSESPMNLTDMIITTSNNVICRCILGQKFDGEGDSWFGEMSTRLMVQLVSFSVGDFFPGLKWIDRVRGHIARLKGTSNEFDRFFDKMIEEHKAAKRAGKAGKNDFVDMLLKLQKDGVKDFDLTKDNIKALLEDMFLGGSFTTATALTWIMAELVRKPKVMEKVQREVRRVVGKKGKIDVNEINQMKYMKCVIKEGLRLHPPAPLLLPRETTADVKLGDFDIPAKTTVFVNAFAIQRDPKVWNKPDEFDPDRFEDSAVDFLGQDFELIPFGGGRRSCPGINFGVASAENVLANILYWFDWKLPSGGKALLESLDMSEASGVTVRKKAPLNLVPVPYTP